jgi:phosphatidylinositol-3-phosphatase
MVEDGSTTRPNRRMTAEATGKESTTMCLHRVITALLLATLIAAPAPRAATDPPGACAAAKRKAVGKKAFDEMKCHAAAAKQGAAVDPLCLQKTDGKFSEALARAEQKGGCLTVGDAVALKAEVDAFVAGAVAALPASGPTTTTTNSTVTTTTTSSTSTTLPVVFVVVMGTRDWSSIKTSSSAPFINDNLVPSGAHAEAYFNPPGLHPSEPNYLWLEAGTSFGISFDGTPATQHQATTSHLVSLLDAAGVSWKAYQEGISGTVCPLADQGSYVVRHDPFVFFDDVTGGNDPNDAYCIAHVRPYSELQADLAGGTVARYNFITPDVCDDMQSACPPLNDPVQQGDAWLSGEVPKILASQAYADGGVLLITWDQAATGDGPIGLIALSPNAKVGYVNTIHYTHSSTLRTLEEIFGVSPLLHDAANATDLADLFVTYP